MKTTFLHTVFLLTFFFYNLVPSSAQWVSQGTGIDLPNRFIESVHVVDESTVWATTFPTAPFTNVTKEWTRTLDGGQTWQHGEIPFTDPSFSTHTIFALDAQTLWVGAFSQPNGTSGGIYKTSDGGQSWTEQFISTELAMGSIHFWNESEGITFGLSRTNSPSKLTAWRTLNGGTDWIEVNMPDVLDNEFGAGGQSGTNLISVINNHIWLGTSEGRVFHSSDRGITWDITEVDSNRWLNSIAFADEQNGITLSTGTITSQGSNKGYRTEDGGTTWQEITIPSSPFGGGIEYIPETEGTFIMTNFASGQKDIAITHDFGRTWKSFNGPGIWSMDFISPTVGWVGGVLQGAEKGGLYRFTSTMDKDHVNLSTFAGNGHEGFSTGKKENAHFINPKGITMDAAGNTYVVNDYADNVSKIDPQGNVTDLIDYDLVGDSLRFTRPQGIVVDNDGNLLVTDQFAYQIKKINLDGSTPEISVWAGAGEYGLLDGTLEEATFQGPISLAKDSSGNIYVGDSYAVRKISLDGMVTTLAGSLEIGAINGIGTNARFNTIWGLAVDEDGTVYLADSYNHLIRKVTDEGVVTTLAGNGSSGYVDGTGMEASFSFPEDIIIQEDGSLLVTDGSNSVIRQISLEGETTTFTGIKYFDYFPGSPGPEAIDGDGDIGTFSRLRDIYKKPNGNLLVSEWGTDLIREVEIGVPSPPLVVMESTIDNPYRIAHFRHLHPYYFSGEVMNSSDFDIKDVRLNVRVILDGIPVIIFNERTEMVDIASGSSASFEIDLSFLPDPSSLPLDVSRFNVEFRYQQGSEIFYTDYQEIIIDPSSISYGDGVPYVGDSYANYFPNFKGGYGVYYSLAEPDSLAAMQAGFFNALDNPTVRFIIYKMEDNTPSGLAHLSDFISYDSLSYTGWYLGYNLPEPIWLETGDYLFVVQEAVPGSINLFLDNDLASDNNWIEDFTTGDWVPWSTLGFGTDPAYMIRPVFGNEQIITNTENPRPKIAEIKVAPNPFTDHLEIQTDEATLLMMQIVNMEGKVVDNFNNLGRQTISKDLSHLSSGAYLLYVSDGQLTQVKRIIKQ